MQHKKPLILMPEQLRMIQEGVVLHQSGQLDAAESHYRKLLKLFPFNEMLLTNLSVIARQKGKLEDAVKIVNQSLQINPIQPNAFNNLGNALKDLNRFDEALASYDRAIVLKPDYAQAYTNRGIALHELNRLDEALASYDCAISLKPDYAETYSDRGLVLQDLQKYEEALASYDCAIGLKPDCALYYWNKSILKLLIGEYIEGWQLYEWGWKCFQRNPLRKFIEPLWLGGESLVNKTIFIYWEQGLGDVIQFIRYVVLVEQLAGKVILEVPKALMAIVSTLEGKYSLVEPGTTLIACDYHCPLMSLPLAFKTTVETIPAQVPYLYPMEDKVNRWKKLIGNNDFKIGVSWQGSSTKYGISKSFPLHLLESISKIKGVRLISLQKQTGIDQLSTLPKGMFVEILPNDFDNEGHAFLDTIAVMKCLDLVITCDTAITHLAGALNVQTWTALIYKPDFRWMLDKTVTPWYPKHRLFRQTIRNEWVAVFKDMEETLQKMVES